MEQMISQAINDKKIIEFTYNGHHRVIEPHVLGISRGVKQVLGYQVGGSSNSGGVPEWRRFDLPGMAGLTVTEEFFPGPRPFPSGRHSSWDVTLVIVS
ncbi:hypothetical protein ACSVCE_18945 [Chromobacterium haemolyticum]|uniref:hypothetical protein n=1 Tax=Chromobacterium haemolyticum TaxID=394935 RepID=UPI0040559489